MPKTDLPKKEKVGVVVTTQYIICPYCSSTNYVCADYKIYFDEVGKRFLCKFCKFSFKVVEVNK